MAVICDREGRVSELHGLPIRLEAYAGTYRTKPGKQPILIASDYGEIIGTVGADGDPLDCYVGVFPEVLNIYVINQATAAGGFDEHKVMFGFLSQAEAVTAYQLSTFNKEPLSVIPCTQSQFNWWLKFGNKKAAVTAQSFPFDPESEINGTTNVAVIFEMTDGQTVSVFMHNPDASAKTITI